MLNVYRGKTLSFAFTPHGRFRLDFLRIPALDRSQVSCPKQTWPPSRSTRSGLQATPTLCGGATSQTGQPASPDAGDGDGTSACANLRG
jgi:hypothetical protein